ncbi:MAG: aminoglycoside 3'-phosphotransferase, partial [Actinobacteria bacterium]|nr:aminoglycoside 3'-phosphotransferase [Actinomycetota bacterium]
MAMGRPVRLVWTNELGGRTFEIEARPDGGADDQRRFVKWAPAGSGIDLRREVMRLRWLVRFTPVPRVLDHGDDAHGSWMMTAALAGESAVAERWKKEPAKAVA